MAKKSYRRRRNGKNGKLQVPVAVLAGMIPTVMEGKRLMDAYGSISGFPVGVVSGLTGWNYKEGNWNWTRLKAGLFPLFLGYLVHSILGQRLGLNRVLSNAGIPLVRI
jgi:hypothetical protein